VNLEIFLQYFINGLTYGAIYALIALGFSVIYRTTEIINFAQGEFVMLGGMFMFTFTKICGLNLWLALILTILTVSIIGIIIQQLFIRPAINSPLVSIIIITIGLSIAIQTTAMLLWGKNSLMLDHFSKIETIKITDEIIIATQNIWILAITIILMFILHYFFEKTMLGKAFSACASNPTAASLMGINRNNMVLLSFFISALLGGISGAILCPLTNVNYHIGLSFGLKGFCAAICGGIGNNIGAILGGFMLGIVQEVGAGVISSGYKDAIAFVILIIFLVFKPSGILGQKWTKRV